MKLAPHFEFRRLQRLLGKCERNRSFARLYLSPRPAAGAKKTYSLTCSKVFSVMKSAETAQKQKENYSDSERFQIVLSVSMYVYVPHIKRNELKRRRRWRRISLGVARMQATNSIRSRTHGKKSERKRDSATMKLDNFSLYFFANLPSSHVVNCDWVTLLLSFCR